MSLFREKVIETRRDRLLGAVALNTPLSAWLFTAFLLTIVASIAAALVFGTFVRRERVAGFLVPDRGLIHVYARDAGVVEQVYVREGDAVEAGAPLVTINKETGLEGVRETVSLALGNLDEQERALRRRLDLTKLKFKSEREGLELSRDSLAGEIEPLREQRSAQTQRAGLAAAQAANSSHLVEKGIMSLTETQRRQDQSLAQKQAGNEVERLILTYGRERKNVESQIKLLPVQEEIAVTEIREQLSALAQRRIEMRRLGHVVIHAPVPGHVGSLQVRPGQAIGAQSLQMTILPKDSRLEAQLFAPTRAAGFIKVGQLVKLRYDAFPYQKFGAAEGRITRISTTVINPNDLKDFKVSDPVYRIIVGVEKQNIEASGQSFALQSGMTLQADVALDRVALWRVVFKPLIRAMEQSHF